MSLEASVRIRIFYCRSDEKALSRQVSLPVSELSLCP